MICVKKAELAGHLHADCSLEVAYVLPLFLFLFIMLAFLLWIHTLVTTRAFLYVKNIHVLTTVR